MSFLQPWILFGLPLAAIPIIIHLINQRRYQTTQWAAMMFLLAANRMNRGYARIRQWAILALRTLVIAALVFAVGRPLSSGLLGGAISGGGSAHTIVLLDRSPSMQQSNSSAKMSKLDSGVTNLTETLTTMGVGRVVLFESNSAEPKEAESPEKLLDLPEVGPSDSSADIPSMMMSALDYIRSNELGQTDVWICSDLRENDWRAKDGRWSSLREAFSEFGRRVRFRLLAFPQDAQVNRSVRVADVVLSETGAEAYVSLKIDIKSQAKEQNTIPVTIEIDGARSTTDVKVDGTSGELKGHRIAVPRGQDRGWGRVSIPADANEADNDFYFTFDIVPPRHTIIVSENPDVSSVLKIAAEITPDLNVQCHAEVVSPGAIAAVDWPSVSLVIWHGAVSSDGVNVLESLVARGGTVIFMPGQNGEASLPFGIRFNGWQEPNDPVSAASWRGDADLLSATLAGASLPVGNLKVNRFAKLEAEATPLATFNGGDPLFVRVATKTGGVYALATTPNSKDSSLAADGVVLYVLIQRALKMGAQSLRNTGQATAGEVNGTVTSNWKPIATRENRLSTERAFTAGVYAKEDRWLALNRDPLEDQTSTVDDDQVDTLFSGLVFDRVDQSAGSGSSLVEEVWRAFLIIMLVAMIGEAILCLPRQRIDTGGSRLKEATT